MSLFFPCTITSFACLEVLQEQFRATSKLASEFSVLCLQYCLKQQYYKMTEMNDTHLAPKNFVALLSHGICANKSLCIGDQSSSLSRFYPGEVAIWMLPAEKTVRLSSPKSQMSGGKSRWNLSMTHRLKHLISYKVNLKNPTKCTEALIGRIRQQVIGERLQQAISQHLK